MNTDLKLTGLDFSWVVTLFYFGQMAGTFLSMYTISRFHVVRVVGITMYDLGLTLAHSLGMLIFAFCQCQFLLGCLRNVLCGNEGLCRARYR